EFFTKNRHLLGFDNPRKALLTCVKEAVDNALDACEEAGILPDIVVKLEVAANGGPPPPASQASRFRITVTHNGPRIGRQPTPPRPLSDTSSRRSSRSSSTARSPTGSA